MTVRKGFLGVFPFIAAVLCVAGFAAAQSQPGAESTSGSDPLAAIKRMGDFLSNAKQFSVTIRVGFDVVQESGQKIEFGEVRKITVARPDRMRVEIERSDGHKSLVTFDGKELTAFSPKDNVYAGMAKPGNLDEAVAYFVRDLQMRMPLAMLFVTSLPAEIDRRVRTADLVEEDVLTGAPFAHLAARAKDVDFQVWLPTCCDPLPQRVVITYRNEEGQPQFWADFSNWNLTPDVSDSLFAFVPPPGAERIPFSAEIKKIAGTDDKKGDSTPVKKGRNTSSGKKGDNK